MEQGKDNDGGVIYSQKLFKNLLGIRDGEKVRDEWQEDIVKEVKGLE